MTLVMAFLVTTLGVLSAQTPSTGSIAGCVVDDLGGLMPGVTVTVGGAGTERKTATDSKGCYAFNDLAPGTYTLTAVLLAFATEKRENIEVRAGDHLRFHLRMKLAPGVIREPPLHIIGAFGSIGGCVTDTRGGLLPGVKVTALGGGIQRSAVTDAKGCYELKELPPGTYTVTGELAGFRHCKRENLAVAAGSRLSLSFRLRIGEIEGSPPPDTLPELWESADAVVHVRITDSGPGPARWLKQTATVLEVLKWYPTARPDETPITFMQQPREVPYRVGDEVILFLWQQGAFDGQAYDGLAAFTVREGMVQLGCSQVVAAYAGMKVEDFLAELRALK